MRVGIVTFRVQTHTCISTGDLLTPRASTSRSRLISDLRVAFGHHLHVKKLHVFHVPPCTFDRFAVRARYDVHFWQPKLPLFLIVSFSLASVYEPRWVSPTVFHTCSRPYYVDTMCTTIQGKYLCAIRGCRHGSSAIQHPYIIAFDRLTFQYHRLQPDARFLTTIRTDLDIYLFVKKYFYKQSQFAFLMLYKCTLYSFAFKKKSSLRCLTL
jgi:hypothetical protein